MKNWHSRFHHNAKPRTFTSSTSRRRLRSWRDHGQFCMNHDFTSGQSRRPPENVHCLSSLLIAKLRRSKRASEAPWVRKIGNPSSRENLVMTSACERASKRASERASGRTSIQTRGQGEERLEISLTVTHAGN